MQGKVEIAGVNTARLKVLKNEETMELLRRTKAGDAQARAALIAASQFGTPEFHQMMEMRQKFPGYTFQEQKLKSNPDRQTYGKLTYDAMRDFIEGHVQEDAARAAALKEYEAVKKLALAQRAAYAYVKKWFLGRYGKEFETFQNKMKAKKEATKANNKE